MKQKFVLASVVAVGLALMGQGLIAQSEGTAAKKPPAEQKTERRGLLPIYFGKLGVSDQQKASMYALQQEYDTKLNALRQQIAQLENERDQKLEELLTPGQKLRLKELRDEAAKEAQAKKQKPAEKK